MNIKGLTANGSATYKPQNEYLYNGKMMQDEMGLGWLDYGARFYDPALARWHSPDPLEQYESGYVYGGNNPISMNDPSGMWAEEFGRGEFLTVINNVGQIIFNDPKSKDKNIYLSPDGRKGSDGNTDGLDVVGNEQSGYDYSKGKYIIPGTNLPLNYRMPQSGNIDEDYTVESLFIPLPAFLWVKFGRYVGKYVFTITAKEGNLIFFSTKVGTKTIEFGGNVSKSKGVLIIKNLDIDGALTNKVGIKGLKEIITDFGKQQGVDKVIIEGAKRTTGANPGRIPSLLIFNTK